MTADQVGVYEAASRAGDSGRRELAHLVDVAVKEVSQTSRNARSAPYAALTKITMLIVEHLPNVDHAGITLVEDRDVVRSLAATDGHPLVVDNIQRRSLEGPCYDAAMTHAMYRADDLCREGRWPVFVNKTLDSTPVRSILAVPVFPDGDIHAALNLYADHAGVLDEWAVMAGVEFARHIAHVIMTRRGRRSVRPTSMVNQAKKSLMQRFEVDTVEAFALLLQLSKDNDESLEVTARRLLTPTPPAPGPGAAG